MVDARQERGLQIAKGRGLKKADAKRWLVPSQSSQGTYIVDSEGHTCTCPDHETRAVKCKHLWAVELAVTIEASPDGTVTTETVKITRKTYVQDWPAYNAAQCAEKQHVQMLLRDLCDGIVTPPHNGRGPKPIPLSDAVYGMTMKVYTTVSGRRATTDIEACANAGHMAKAPHYNSIFNYFEKPEMTALLTSLVEQSAAPLASVESKFAIDSTGFGTSIYRRWFDHKYGREMKEHTWIKAHIVCGVTTNIVTAVNVTDGFSNDSPEMPALIGRTDRTFTIAEVSADKAYLSHNNLAAVTWTGATPYIPFKSNSQGDGSAAWRRMFHLYNFKREEFLQHYHQRSNVESTFSAMKRKFGANVRSKLFTAQINEVLCKVLCYNLSVLVHSMYELGIDPRLGRAA